MITQKLAKPPARSVTAQIGQRKPPGPAPIPTWDGAMRNNLMATLGDSFVENGSNPAVGFESYGGFPNANRLSGQRLIWAVERNFGQGGDSTEMAEARLETALATGVGVLGVNAGTNDATLDYPVDRSMASLKRMKQRAYETKTVIVFVTPAPRGNDAFPDKRLSGARLSNALSLRTRMLEELPGVGCYVVDNRAALLKPGTENDLINAYSHDGLHMNTSGAFQWAKPVAAKYKTFAPAVPLISKVENPWSASNPTGSASANSLMKNSGGSPGTGGSGVMAASYSGANATGLTGVTRTYSKVIKGDEEWQQIVIGGVTATQAAGLDLMRQTNIKGNVTPGLVYEVVGKYEIDAGMQNILSLQLGFQIASPTYNATLWDGDRYVEGSFLTAEANQGDFRTPRFVMPAEPSDLRMRLTSYISTLGPPVGTVRVTGLELRPVR